jgi:HK97 gp10 family phage protein
VITGTVTGLPDLRAALRALPVTLRNRVLRNALATAARPIRDSARRLAPVMKPGRNVHRTPGLLKRSIVVRTSSDARRRGNVGVFVNVRPAKGAKYATETRTSFGRKVRVRRLLRASQRGARSKLDPFYWRFLEFGTKHIGKREFLTRAAAGLGQAARTFAAAVGPQIRKLNDRFIATNTRRR